MNNENLLSSARQAIAVHAPSLTEVIRSLPSEATAATSSWTARETAVHLVVGGNLYAEMVTGAASPFGYRTRQQAEALDAVALADIPETAPGKLADLVADGIDRILGRTVRASADQRVGFHAGTDYHLGGILAIYLGEILVHGYDLAAAAGRPWRIRPEHAAIALAGYFPVLGLFLDPSLLSGHDDTYVVDVRGMSTYTFCLAHGRYTFGGSAGPNAFEAAAERADCAISAEPNALLLVLAGRLRASSATALGLIEAVGPHAERVLSLGVRVVFP